MSLNIIDLIKEQLGPALISQASTHLGESESGISKAINALVPTVVAGLANNADKPAVVDSILATPHADLLGNLTGNSQNSMVPTILTSIFGDKIGAISNTVSGVSDVSDSSASSLLNMVTGATVGTLGKYASENNLDSKGLSSLLSDQKGMVSSLLPAGLSLASLGFEHLDHSETVVPSLAENIKVTSYDEPKVDVTRAGDTHMNVEPDNNDGGGSIWKWLLPLLIALLAAWFVWNQYNKKNVTTTAATSDSTMMKSDSATAIVPVDSTMMKSDSATAKVPADSTSIK
jgi:hypothetical protein